MHLELTRSLAHQNPSVTLQIPEDEHLMPDELHHCSWAQSRAGVKPVPRRAGEAVDRLGDVTRVFGCPIILFSLVYKSASSLVGCFFKAPLEITVQLLKKNLHCELYVDSLEPRHYYE